MKRQVLKLSSFYGVIATSFKEMQLDPPESIMLNSKSTTISFINFESLIESGLYDGVAKTLLHDLHNKLLNNEFGHVMNQFITLNSSGSNNIDR